jgi:hypothetical protein
MRALLTSYDSIQEFEQARHDRLWDGLTLWSEGHSNGPPGAVYLLGCSVEIALKCAYFRVLGLRISDPLDTELRQAPTIAKFLGVVEAPESRHSVLFWSALLRAKRRQLQRPFDPQFELRLVAETRIVYDRWCVEMRYKANKTTPAMLEAIIAAAEWFDRNYTQLQCPSSARSLTRIPSMMRWSRSSSVT